MSTHRFVTVPGPDEVRHGDSAVNRGHVVGGDVARQVRDVRFERCRDPGQGVEVRVRFPSFEFAKIGGVKHREVGEVLLADPERGAQFSDASSDGTRWQSRNWKFHRGIFAAFEHKVHGQVSTVVRSTGIRRTTSRSIVCRCSARVVRCEYTRRKARASPI